MRFTKAVSAAVLLTGLTAVPAGAQVTPVQKWCNATASYFRVPSAGNLDAMLTRSEVISWKYAAEDTADVYVLSRSGKLGSHPRALAYLREDFLKACNR